MTDPAEIHVALVGAGTIGRNHLRSLGASPQPLRITVVDPSEASRAAALALSREEGWTGAPYVAFASVLDIPDVPDVAIVATNSRERAETVCLLVAAGVKRLVLEKVLFHRLDTYDQVGRLLAESKVACWVNCARRTYSSFPILSEFTRGSRLNYTVEGKGWGLACNVVHHLDEFAALAGEAPQVIDASGLDPGFAPAKRTGYVEFFGTIRAQTPSGSCFLARCSDGNGSTRRVTIETDKARAVLDQASGEMTIRAEGNARTLSVEMPYQSRITATHVADILAGRQPRIPDYAAASAVHRPMLQAFLGHLRTCAGFENAEDCPIT